MRQVINKLIREEDLYAAVRRGVQPGMEAGQALLPHRPADRDRRGTLGIVELAKQCVAIGRRYHQGVTVTRRWWLRPQGPDAVPVVRAEHHRGADPQVHLLRDAARPVRGLTIRWHDPKATAAEGIVSRGDRRMGPVIEHVWRAGGTFQEWSEHSTSSSGPRRSPPRGCRSRNRVPASPRGRGAAVGPPLGGPPPRLPVAGLADALAEFGLPDCRWTPC